MKTALVAGATGLIGRQLLTLLLQDDRYDTVKAISRSPLDVKHPRLENVVVAFGRLEAYTDRLKADHVFCCLGTTMKQARSKEAFEKVDCKYPVALARIAHEQGAGRYLLVSALGAGKDSSVYYNRVKGQVEEAIKEVGFNTVHIFRPSLLLGPRAEKRSGEEAAKIVYRLFDFLIPKKYKAIESVKVAAAMRHFAALDQPGVYIHESASLQEF